MLKGLLQYRDLSSGNYDGDGQSYLFNINCAESVGAMNILLHAVGDFSKRLNASKCVHRVLKGKVEDFSEAMDGCCRIDVANTVKTNAVNIVFASRIGCLFKHLLNRSFTDTEQDGSKYICRYDNDAEDVHIDLILQEGVPLQMQVHTKYIDLNLNTTTEYVFFPKFEKKNSVTPIKTLSIKESEELLGFSLVKPEIDMQGLAGAWLYGSLEEVVKAHPEKNYSWLLEQNYVIVDKGNVDAVLDEFMNYDDLIAFDTETTGLSIQAESKKGFGDTIVGFSLSKEQGVSYYFPLAHKMFENVTDDIDFFMQTKLKPLLETKQIVCHNTAFDWKVCYLYGIRVNVVFDTQVFILLTYRAEDSTYPFGLKEVCKKKLHLDMLEMSDFLTPYAPKGASVAFADLVYELVRCYATTDADITLRLAKEFKNSADTRKYNVSKVFALEVEFQKVVAYSEYWGYQIDTDSIPKFTEETYSAMKKAEQEMFEIVGHEFNANSSVQLKKIMYTELGIKPLIVYAHGFKPWEPKQLTAEEKKQGCQLIGDAVYKPDYSTKEENLQKLAALTDENDNKPLYPFVHVLLRYKAHTNGKAFIAKLPEYLSPTGIIYPKMFAIGTDTGRVTVKNPNYQSYSGLVKHYVKPRRGFIHFDCDYSQIEYRVLASLAGQTNLCDAFCDPDMDYHTYQASRMFNVPYAMVTSALRKQAKGINFGIPYGMGNEALGGRIFGEISAENTKKAEELHRKYMQGQNKIEQLFLKSRACGVQNGYTETLLGRRRYYDRTKDSKGKIERRAGNHVIQGSAADIFKMGVVAFFEMLIENDWLDKVLIDAFVHDEMLLEIHHSISPYVFLRKWRETYQVKLPNFCPLYAGCGFGSNWYVAKSQDLPVQFIQMCIDKVSGDVDTAWDGATERFLVQIEKDYYQYKIGRVREYITNKANDGVVIKPLINNLLTEVLDTELGKGYCKGKTVPECVAKFVEHFGVKEQVYDIKAVDAVVPSAIEESVQKTPSEEYLERKKEQLQMERTQRIVEGCKAFGCYADAVEGELYLRVFDANFMAYVKTLTADKGYALRFIEFKDGKTILYKPNVKIAYGSLYALQNLCRTKMKLMEQACGTKN